MGKHFSFQIWSHINLKIDTMTKWKKKDDHPIWSRKRREEREKSDQKGSKSVWECSINTKYIECIFKMGSTFFHLFQIWEHINFKVQTKTNMKNKDDHNILSRREERKREKRERERRRVTNKGQRVLRELYRP